ncbi:MAG: TraR/DksA family transcriptional regulator [Sulfurifustaceae bacterium]
MAKLTAKEIRRFEQRLRKRQEELRGAIDSALTEAKTGDAVQSMGSVRDPGDDSVAELSASTNMRLLDRETAELRDVEGALERIRLGTYGVCVEGGEEIERERLEAYPAAKRCFDHERRLEKDRAGGSDMSPSL